MPFVRTPRDHTVVIANTDSWVMDSIAPVRKQRQKRCMSTLCSTSNSWTFFSSRTTYWYFNGDDVDFDAMSLLMSI